MTLYHVTIADGSVGQNGLAFWVSAGEPINVDGQPMVRLPHGTIVPAQDWQTSRAESLRLAALRIEELGLRLLQQAKTVRADADKEVP